MIRLRAAGADMSTSIIMTVLLALGLGYVLGSIPFGLLLTRAAGLGDVRDIGSGSIGATNVLRTGNKTIAALTLLLDALKGTVAVLLAPKLVQWLGMATPVASAEPSWRTLAWLVGVDANILVPPGADPTQYALNIGLLLALVASLAAALGAFLGHIYPVWLGFKGGKGVATYIGVLIGLSFMLALVFCAVWLLVAVVTRYSSLSALVASVVVPVVASLMFVKGLAYLATLLSFLLIWKHSSNIARLRSGTEPKIGAKTKAG